MFSPAHYIFPYYPEVDLPDTHQHLQTPLSAGAAMINTTPHEPPIPLAGFYVRQSPFDGVHDDLYARAIAFESEGEEAVIISVDICALTDPFRADVTGRISAKYSVPKENILLSATHTHGGPALYEPPNPGVMNTSWLRGNPFGEKQKKYTEELKEKIVSVIGEARKNCAPVRIGFGAGSSPIGINRRALTSEGDVWLGVNPEGPSDSEVPVVRIDSESGKTLAILFNYGCHGTSMRSDQITGDWCGIASQYIEEKWGGGIIAPFLQGAGGDVNPIYNEKKEFDDRTGGADVLAKMLGEEVIGTARGIIPRYNGPVLAFQRTVALPGKRYMGLLGFDPHYDDMTEDTSPVPDTLLTMSALKVGDVMFAGSSGEIFSEIGMDFKRKSPNKNVMFIGLCNGYSSYVLSDAEINRGGYEYNATIIREGGQAAVVDTLLGFAAEM